VTRQPRRMRSTGAEATPPAPVTVQAAIGAPVSTDAEPFDDTPVTTAMSHLNEPITVHSPTPGPVTMTVGWLADTEPATAEAKVIKPAERPSPASARTQARTKNRNRGRAGDR
jgi:hypothetical protein